MEKTIQFIANYDDWIAIKKLKIEEKTEPLTIMEFLASLTFSVDRKVEENLKKTIELKAIDEFINEESGNAKGEKGIIKALTVLNSRKFSSLIKEALKNITEKKLIKELESFIRVYATRKMLKELKLKVDYSSIDTPEMRKLTKKKKLK